MGNLKKIILETSRIEKSMPRVNRYALKRARIMKKANIEPDVLDELQQVTIEEQLEESMERAEVDLEVLDTLKDIKEKDPEIEIIDSMIENQEHVLRYDVEDTIRQENEIKKQILLSKAKKAKIDDPQAYVDETFQDDKKEDSSKQENDTITEAIIKALDDPGRFVIETAKIKSTVKRKIKGYKQNIALKSIDKLLIASNLQKTAFNVSDFYPLILEKYLKDLEGVKEKTFKHFKRDK